MKVYLSDIKDEGLEAEFEEAIESAQFKLLFPLKASLKIDKADSEVFIKGKLHAVFELQCSRCLKMFSKPLDINVNVVYHPITELTGEHRHEIHDDELDTDFYKGDELDIDALLKEQLILNSPMQPLCSSSCKGICHICGADLNTGQCGCGQREADSRLAVLKTLLSDRKE